MSKHKIGTSEDVADWAVGTGRIAPEDWGKVAGTDKATLLAVCDERPDGNLEIVMVGGQTIALVLAELPLTPATIAAATDRAALFVRAVNAHDALVGACEMASRIFGGHSGALDDPKTSIEITQGFSVIDLLRAALVLAGKVKP